MVTAPNAAVLSPLSVAYRSVSPCARRRAGACRPVTEGAGAVIYHSHRDDTLILD